MRLSIWIPVSVLLLAAAVGSLTAAVQVGNAVQETDRLNEQLRSLCGEFHVLAGSEAENTNETPLPDAEQFELRTAAEAEEAIKKLGDAPTTHQIAICLLELDEWVIRPDDEQSVLRLKQGVAAQLREQVRQEVIEKLRACLSAPSGDESIRIYGEAGQILALYPMSEDQYVIDEAKALSARRIDIANRIDVLRRQRYNQWASRQIESAIDGYNKKSSYWSPMRENGELMDSLVQSLGEIDPVLIEPAVMELYNYVIDLTKGSISEKDKIDLAKRLTDPSISRKTLGDF
jgi:hypothetical protein